MSPLSSLTASWSSLRSLSIYALFLPRLEFEAHHAQHLKELGEGEHALLVLVVALELHEQIEARLGGQVDAQSLEQLLNALEVDLVVLALQVALLVEQILGLSLRLEEEHLALEGGILDGKCVSRVEFGGQGEHLLIDVIGAAIVATTHLADESLEFRVGLGEVGQFGFEFDFVHLDEV